MCAEESRQLAKSYLSTVNEIEITLFARTLPLFEEAEEVPTVVDLVTVAFEVPVTPDRIVIVEGDELVPITGVVTGAVTPELVITGMVVVVVGAPVGVSVVEMPRRMSLSALSAMIVLLEIGQSAVELIEEKICVFGKGGCELR